MVRSCRVAGRRAGSLLAVLALVAGLLTITSTVTPAPTANAATVNIGTIQAQMANQQGRNNGTTGNCIKYLPNSGTGSSNTSSAWVTNSADNLPNSAITAHGYSGSSCPSSLSTTTQSALGFRPSTVTSVTDGATFLIGAMTHYNNPIQANDQYFTGDLNAQLGNFSGTTLTFNWTMNETPNTGGGNCCNDITTFNNQISDVTLTQNGLSYKLVILGFVANSSATTCPATPPAGSTPQNEFSTVEGAQTNACLYASLQQLRTLKIVKNVVGSPPGTPTFNYTSTSSLAGSPWSNATFSLANGGSKQDQLTAGNTVTVTEGDPADDRWTLTGLVCQQYNAAGQLVTMDGTTSLASRRVTLDPVPAPLYGPDPSITCTYTNTYTPRTTLTLQKSVQSGPASPALWTLTATGTAAPTTGTVISGASGSGAVTNQRIVAGTYQLTELGTGDAQSGYVQVGNWTCSYGSTTVTVSPAGQVTLPNLPTGTTVTCRVVNRQATGSLQISKIVNDPGSGYTGGTSKAFSGSYDCGTGYTGTFTTLTTAAPVTVSGIPVGRSCTVTENAPTGGLLNASFAWGAPSYSTQPVVITDGGTAQVIITNTVVQKFGTFALTKTITGPGGYTGGVNRVFPVSYTCTLTNGPTSTGSLDLTAAGPVSPARPIPTGSSCTFTENLTFQPGDFGDPSYKWSGSAVNPTPVVIGDNTTSAVVVTNTYVRRSGQLVLAKLIDGAGYIRSGENFTVGYNCGVVSGQVTLARDASKAVSVPAGNTCTVAELPPDDKLLSPAYAWGTPTWSDGSNATNVATVPADGSVTLTVTNHTVPIYGRVQVNKEISGAIDGVTANARFAITVTCDNDYSNTFNVTVAGTGQTPDLPVGTTCTVTEDAPADGLVDSSYAWGPPVVSPSGSQKITQANQLINVTVTNPVVRVTGDLVITKRLVDPSNAVDRDRVYTIDYSCSYTGVTWASGTVQLRADGSATVEDIPLESRCTVIEDPANLNDPPVPGEPSWVWLPPTYDPGTSVLITSADTPATVTITNTTNQLTGTFQLTKSVVGQGKQLGYVPGSTFTFSVECDNGYSGTAVIADGQSWQPTETIPQGTECTITEIAKPDPTSAAYGWDDVIFTVDRTSPGSSPGATFTVGATPIQINATNPITPRFGTLQITKNVIGETDGLTSDASFQFSVNCGPGNLFVVTMDDLAGGTQTEAIPNVPVGSTCTVSEFPPDPAGLVDTSYAWADAQYTPADATVTIDEEGQTVGITVTNPIVRVTAPVTVVKTLTGGQGVIDPARTYPISWSCTYGGVTVASGTFDAVVDPTGVEVDDDVPVTSQCTATEGDLGPPSTDPAYRWLTPRATGTTVSAAGPNVVTVANSLTRDNGQVVVNKEVTGASDGYIGTGADFTMHGQCLVPGHPEIPTRYADGTIANHGSVTISPVSVGWTCSGFEDTPSQGLLKDASYAWGTPVITGRPALTPEIGGTFVLPGAGAIQEFDVQNPVVRVSSTFRITKTVVDPFGALVAGTQFSGTYSCTYGGDEPVTGTWTLENGGTFTGPSVYLNSVCTVTENDLGTTGLANGSFAWAAPTIGAPVTVVPGGTATVAVVNTVERLYGGLAVTKTLTGETAGVKPGTTFTGVWTCTLGDQTWTDRWTVGANASVTVFTAADAKVPATAVCSIVEDTPSADALVDGSYAWADRTYDPASVTLADGQTGQLGVTNTVQRVYSSFEVAKRITGPVQADGLVPTGRQFTGTWSCRYGTDDPVTGTWTASVATAWVQPGILVGSICTVTGETPPGAGGQPVTNDSSYVWTGTPDLGTTATVTPPTAANQTITVTNPTDRIFGRFYLSKSVSGDIGGITDPEPFPMTYSCQPGDGPAITGDVSVSAGERVDVGPDEGDDVRVNIPVGSVCTLTEPLDTMPPLKDSAWRWDDPEFEVVGDIPTAGPVTQTCVAPPAGEPQVTPCLGFPARSVTVTIPRPQEDYPEPPTVGLAIDNPVVKTDGSYTVTKTSDPGTGSVVLPGQTVTYSVTVTSTGDVPVHDVVVTDDLSSVLPSATLGTITAPDGTTAALTGTRLVWTVGDVPNGETRTLTYQITVNPGAVGVTIKNLVTATGDVPPEECDPCTTDHTTPLPPTITKAADGLPVFDAATGTWTVPYAITVTNPNPDDAVPYTLTDHIAFPTNVPIVSGSVTSAPDGVTLADPPWNGSDRTTIAADATLPAGATHTYRVAVVATVPPTLDSAQLECAATGSGGGSGFFNLAAVSSMGTSSSADACDPIPVMLVVTKQWVIDGVAYTDGDQPAGYSATPTIGGVEALWGTVYVGFAPGTVVDVQETATVPDSCATSATGTGEVTLTAPLTSLTVTNVVDCAGPPPTTTPTTPAPTTTLTTLTTAYPPGPGPTPPLPNTGFSIEPFVFWGLGLLLAGGLLMFGARRRWHRPPG